MVLVHLNMKPPSSPPPHPRSIRVKRLTRAHLLQFLVTCAACTLTKVLAFCRLTYYWHWHDNVWISWYLMLIYFYYKFYHWNHTLREILVMSCPKKKEIPPRIFNFPGLKMLFRVIMKWEIRFCHFNFEALLSFPRVLFILLSVCNLLQYK